VARFGGEEFVLLLPHTTQTDARMLAERLRRTVEQTPVLITTSGNDYQELRVTISIGLSCIQQKDDSSCDMLERADKALYQAKQTGRNRVIACDDMAGSTQGEVTA
jgi:two-component system cell cycle response regulator